MSTRKPREKLPRHFVWSSREHRRFTDAVEKLVSTVNDLSVHVVQLRRQLDEHRALVASGSKGGAL